MNVNSDSNYNSQSLLSVNAPTFLTTVALAFSANMATAGNSDLNQCDITNSYIWQHHIESNSVIEQGKTYVFIPPRSFKKRYVKIVQANWFHKAYDNMTVGDVILVDE